MSLPYTVKPLPAQYCENCFFNGCFPWSRNPLLRCIKNGGIMIVINGEREVNDVPLQSCFCFRLVKDEDWTIWVTGAKQESQDRQETRRKAIHQIINSNQKEDALIY